MSGPSGPLLGPDVGRILLLRLRSVGDAVLLLPLVAALRRERPHAHLAVLLEQPAAALLDGQPGLDRVLVARRGLGGRLASLRELRRARFDLVLDLHGGPTAAWLTRLSGARLRVGLESYRRGGYSHRLASPFKGSDRQVTLHTVESNLAIARALGLDPPPGLGPVLSTTAAGQIEARQALAAAGLAATSGYVVIHPGAALRSKTWPAERFAAVARTLAADGLAVAAVTPPGDGPRLAPAPGLHVVPPLTLPGLAALIAGARLFVGNDSGPAHIAAALAIPTVAVFGSQDPRVWRPWGATSRALAAGLPCSPCRGQSCENPRPYECLDRVPAETVVAASRELVGRG